MRRTEIGSGLTSGQQNAVRAAFKAGVKPSAIARQFRIFLHDDIPAERQLESERCVEIATPI